MKPNDAMISVIANAQHIYDTGDWERGADLIINEFGGDVSATYKRMISNQFKGLTREQAETFHEHCRYIATVGRLEDFIDLRKITAQTCIINGAEDNILDLEDMYAAHRMIPDCEMHIVEGVGHFLHFERPELLEMYAEFLLKPMPGLEARAGA